MNSVNQKPHKGQIISRQTHVVCLVIPGRLRYRYWCIVYPHFDMPHYLDMYTLQFVRHGLNTVGNCDIVCTFSPLSCFKLTIERIVSWSPHSMYIIPSAHWLKVKNIYDTILKLWRPTTVLIVEGTKVHVIITIHKTT